MRAFFYSFLAILAIQSVHAAGNKDMKKETEIASYTIGANIAGSLKGQAPDMDVDKFLQGFKDGYTGAKPQYSETERMTNLTSYQERIQKALVEKQAKAAEENLKAGEKFLAENKTKEGVVTTKSGLQYKVITEGKGETPSATDKVTTHYSGRLINGDEFDSSYKRGQPATFPVNGVIQGWQEALQKMKVGGKWQLYIPHDLAYGSQGAGDSIPPNSTLVFDIELQSIAK